jgi:hypothetical protein
MSEDVSGGEPVPRTEKRETRRFGWRTRFWQKEAILRYVQTRFRFGNPFVRPLPPLQPWHATKVIHHPRYVRPTIGDSTS